MSTSFESALEKLRVQGYIVLRDVLSSDACADLAGRIDAALRRELDQFGEARLRELREFGQVRSPCAFDPVFLSLLLHPHVMPYIEATIEKTAILHLQNAIVTFPDDVHWQSRFHRDFAKDFVADRPLSMNAFFLIDDFDATTGATWFVPQTHQNAVMPSESYLERARYSNSGPPRLRRDFRFDARPPRRHEPFECPTPRREPSVHASFREATDGSCAHDARTSRP